MNDSKGNSREIAIILSVVFILVFFLPCLIISIMFRSTGTNFRKISPQVEMYRPAVAEFAGQYGISEYVDVLLAVMMIESGGQGGDPMQCSESLGLSTNSITDPIFSIQTGVKYFADIVRYNKSKNNDFWTAVQSYNFGSGFCDFVADRGNTYNFELSCSFSEEMSSGDKVSYFNQVADFNGNWRYTYGNMYYVKLIQQYICGMSETGDTADPLNDFRFILLKNEFEKYQGWGYTWGGSSPSTGFDCSGLVQYCYSQVGINLPRTAKAQYNATVSVFDPKPGDLIFFKNTVEQDEEISHIAIYIDDEYMFHSGGHGIVYTKWATDYWKSKLVGFTRILS